MFVVVEMLRGNFFLSVMNHPSVHSLSLVMLYYYVCVRVCVYTGSHTGSGQLHTDSCLVLLGLSFLFLYVTGSGCILHKQLGEESL